MRDHCKVQIRICKLLEGLSMEIWILIQLL
jgi:hypothetical protein